MIRLSRVLALTVSSMLVFSGCDQGIQPLPASSASGFSGTIRYNNWPPADSLIDLRLVAFRKFPPGDILTEVFQDSAIVYPALGSTSGLPFNVDTTHYFAPTPAGSAFRYVVVAQRFGADILHDWRAVGQYDLDTNLDIPSPIQVPAEGTLMHVDINVDFKHLPPQPF